MFCLFYLVFPSHLYYYLWSQGVSIGWQENMLIKPCEVYKADKNELFWYDFSVTLKEMFMPG